MSETNNEKAVITCALNGVLTDPSKHPVPVTPEEMAAEARRAWDAGATVVHVHFRRQEQGMGRMPSWDPEVAGSICDAIREEVPGIMINMSTGILGNDISGPVACLERVKPEMAALNAGSLNYLKTRRNGEWAWPPLLFDNPVEKVTRFFDAITGVGAIPECECFDTGIVRSVGMYLHNGMVSPPVHISLVMGVASGMPAKPQWIPLLLDEMPEQSDWQSIVIGRQDVWDVHRKTAELGGHLRTGLEDTFYLPDGEKTDSNGTVVEALARIARETGREVATADEARELMGVSGSAS